MAKTFGMISNEVVGTFIDAVYAIAITLLALELPGQFESTAPWSMFGTTLAQYAVAFALLFVFWLDHRRINAYVESYDRRLLAISGFSLFLVCLIPTATSLVFQYGDDVTLANFESNLLHNAELTAAEAVDLFFVVVVIATDGALLATSRLGMRHVVEEPGLSVRRAKATSSVLLLVVVGFSLLLPVENRYFTLVLPLAVFFEGELGRLLSRVRASARARKPAT